MKIRQTLRISHVALALIPLVVLATITTSSVRTKLFSLGDSMAKEAELKTQEDLQLHAEAQRRRTFLQQRPVSNNWRRRHRQFTC